MNKLSIIKSILQKMIDDIDAGNSNHSEEEYDEIISQLSLINNGVKRLSKRYICDNVLHCSSSTFDNYIALGIIPKGHKSIGFKELCWSMNDLKSAKEYRRKQLRKNTIGFYL